MKTYDFDQNLNDPFVYKLIKDGKVIFIVLYVDDILLIANSIELLLDVNKWLVKKFQVKNMG